MTRRNQTKFEDLSTEVLFDIFEYFRGEELFDAFYGLNYRMNNILNDNRLLMHITFSRIKTIQSLYDSNQIQFLYITLSSSSHPSVAADLRDSSLMPCARRLSLDGVYMPDLRVGLSDMKTRMPNLVHVAIKTYHSSSPSENSIAFIIESLLDLSLIRTFSLKLTNKPNGTVYINLSNKKQVPFLEYLSIIGCNVSLHSIIGLISNNSPNLRSLQMSIRNASGSEDFSVLQQLSKATLKLTEFDNKELQRFFSSMTHLISLRLDGITLIPTARLYIPDTARLSLVPFGYFDN
jgi:hypothetical protein